MLLQGLLKNNAHSFKALQSFELQSCAQLPVKYGQMATAGIYLVYYHKQFYLNKLFNHESNNYDSQHLLL